MASFADIDLDTRVLSLLKSGDVGAVGPIYECSAAIVHGMALRILQDSGLAQEVVQDTFVELIENVGNLRKPHAVIGWLRKVAVNHCYMRLRSPWHQRRVGIADEGLDREDTMSSGERAEGVQDIEQALSLLDPEARMVIWLHDVEGYTHGEIGTVMGRTPSYSKSQLARGYQKLLGQFGGEDEKASVTAIRPAGAP
jgi:RNA polymerase sigma-70 factor (ECF subfamily)